MSTDGVKIIDGDTAHDTYWGIMDLYDDGASIETIKEQVPFPQSDYYDDFDYEIYTTAYALAAWEIGFITEEMVQEVKSVINKGACVKEWTESHGTEAGEARQKELNDLWNQITSPNPDTRKRKVYPLVTTFLFDINEVLAFKAAGSNYYITVVLDITQYRGNCTYRFGKILYDSETLPTIDAIKNSDIVGRKIPSGAGMDMTAIFSMSIEEMQQQGGLEEILKQEAEKTGSFVIGMDAMGIEHSALGEIASQFIKIGHLHLNNTCKEVGSMGGFSTVEELAASFGAPATDTFKIADMLTT